MYAKDKMILQQMGLIEDNAKVDGKWGTAPFTLQQGNLRIQGGTLQGRLADNPGFVAGDVRSITFQAPTHLPSDSSRLFSGSHKLERIQGLDNLDTSTVTDMGSMFRDDPKLYTIDVTAFDTHKVTNMSHMFQHTGMESIDISDWDVSNALDMSNMFSDNPHLIAININGLSALKVQGFRHFVAHNDRLRILDMTNFTTQATIDMNGMFLDNPRVTKLDISGLNANHVQDMEHMFEYCNDLRTILGIYNLATPKYNQMRYMFECDHNLETLMDMDTTALYHNSNNSLDDIFS